MYQCSYSKSHDYKCCREVCEEGDVCSLHECTFENCKKPSNVDRLCWEHFADRYMKDRLPIPTY